MNDDQPVSPADTIPAQDAAAEESTRFRKLGRWAALLAMLDAPPEDIAALAAAGSPEMRNSLGRFLMHYNARGAVVLEFMRQAIAESVESYVWTKGELILETQAKLAGSGIVLTAKLALGYLVALTVAFPHLTGRIRRGDTGKQWTHPLRTHWRGPAAGRKAPASARGQLSLFSLQS